MSGALEGKVAIVTGAGRGIGAAVARRLARDGAWLVLAGRGRDALEAVASDVRAQGGLATCVAADVSRPEDVERLVAHAYQEHERIDLLVNNAGVVATGRVRAMDVADFDRMLAVNVRGVFLCCRSVLGIMEAQGAGHIINVASVAARVGFPEWAGYCATKAAVAGLSRALREEVRGQGIRVTVIYPASTDTPLWEAVPGDFDRSRMLTVDNVADAIAYAAARPPTVLVEELSITWPLGNQ